LFQPIIENATNEPGSDTAETGSEPDAAPTADENAPVKLNPIAPPDAEDEPVSADEAKTVPLSTLPQGLDEDDGDEAATRVLKPVSDNENSTSDQRARPDETMFQPMVELNPENDADNREGEGIKEVTLPPVPDRGTHRADSSDASAPTRPLKPLGQPDASESDNQATVMFTPPKVAATASQTPTGVGAQAGHQKAAAKKGRSSWLIGIPLLLAMLVVLVFWLRPVPDGVEQPKDDLTRVLELQSQSLERATQLSSKVTAVLTRSRQVRLELADLDLKLRDASEADRQDLQERRDDLALLAEGLGEQAILIRDHVLANVDLAVVEQMAGALPMDPSEGELAELEADYTDLIDKLEQALVTQQRLESAVTARKDFQGAVSQWRSFGFSWPVSPVDVERLTGRAQSEGLAGFEFPDPTSDAEVLLAAGRFEEAAAAWAQGADDIGILVRQASEKSELTDTRVRSLLASAELALENRQLTSPEDDNALSYYRQVLEVEPNNPTALGGIGRIVEAYRSLLAGAIAADRLDTAETYLGRAESVDPQAAAVADMREQLASAKARWTAERLSSLMVSMRTADAKSDLAGAELTLREISALAPASAELAQAQQIRQAIAVRPGRVFQDAMLEGQSGPPLVIVPTGQFQMGTSGRQLARLFGAGRNEAPAHTVDIEQVIAVAQHETTVREFGQFIADSGYQTDAQRGGAITVIEGASARRVSDRNWQHDFLGQQAAPDAPVIHVSWNDAQAYADWLSKVTGERYRLPSESEFEFALRAGVIDRYAWGDGSLKEWSDRPDGKGDLRRYRDGFFGPAPVASFEANAFRLHDMLGNVSEWVADCYLPDYKGKGSEQSARIAPDCSRRTVRGASWASEDDTLRLSWRGEQEADAASNTIGFRVVRDLRADSR
jgi:formylglycine-generating enzyme required for sulfatase activity